jgi:carbamoylphosphate synthase large subunit
MPDNDKEQDMQRVTVLGMLDGDGQNSVVLHLFPSAVARVMSAAEWAKAHPEAEHIEIVLHGERPDALIMTMPRTALLVMAADMVRQENGVTLQ